MHQANLLTKTAFVSEPRLTSFLFFLLRVFQIILMKYWRNSRRAVYFGIALLSISAVCLSCIASRSRFIILKQSARSIIVDLYYYEE